jgi:hypothetical protein
MTKRRSIPALLISLALLLAGVLGVLLLKPDKPSMRIYSIGEQGLAEAEGADRGVLDTTVVARVGGYAVTAGEVDGALKQLPPFQRFYYSSPEQVEVFLQNYAMFLLLASQGLERGVDVDAYVRTVTEETLVDQYRQAYLANAVKASDVPDEAVQAYLANHRQDLQVGEEGGQSPAQLATSAKAAILEERRTKVWEQYLATLR